MTTGNRVGRPLKFASPEELQEKIEAYFADCDPHWEEYEAWIDKKDSSGKPIITDGVVQQEFVTKKRLTKQKPYTITGLAVALDTTRETLLDYQDKDEFSDTIKKAKEKIHGYVESRLFDGQAAGPIFNLKNNYGWKDKYDFDNTNQPQKVLVEFVGDEAKEEDADSPTTEQD